MLLNFKNHQRLLITKYKGKRLIIDTGSPMSFLDSIMGQDPVKYSQKLGAKVDGLMGLDMLGDQFTFFKDSVDTGLVVRDADPIKMQKVLGFPLIEVVVGGYKLRAIIDTGAQISYVPAKAHPQFGVVFEDHSPLLGDFVTEATPLEFEIGSKQVTLDTGYMPPALRALTKIQMIDVIIGSELLDHFIYSVDLPYCYLTAPEV